MGLDIAAYRGLTKLDALFNEHGEPVDPQTGEAYDDYFQPWVNDYFTQQADGIEHRGVYSYEDLTSFGVGSYRGYNVWREQLANLAGYPLTARGDRVRHQYGAFEGGSGPFHELICFSDCEGVIGAETSAKLANDFALWDDRAKALGDDWFYAWFYERYTNWRKAFEMAADGGAVSFR